MGRKYKDLSRRIKKLVPNLHKLRSTTKRKYTSTKNKIKKTKSNQSTRKTSNNKYKKKEKHSNNDSDADIIIKSVTPEIQRTEGKKIYLETKKKPKIGMLKRLNKLETIDEEKENNFALQSIRSFSPKINKELVSLKSIVASNIFKCKNLLETNVGSRCLDYTSKEVKDKLLKNLRASKHLDCSKFIAPKQYNSNCWFNTLFVTFFFSDKGRKFFRFIRQLMISGKKVNGEEIPDELARVFFIFNKIIEASYNQDGNTDYKLIANYNTNYFIENIYDILLKKNIVTYKKNQSGNPLEYYIAIIKYLNYNAVNIENIDISERNDFNNIDKKIRNPEAPEIIVVEIIDEDAVKIDNRPIEFDISIQGKKHKYKLDAAIIRDISKQHFCSVLTCNNREYSFDGASYSRLSEYNWKDNINKSTKWGFEGHTLKWNFMKGYQMLFYYKI